MNSPRRVVFLAILIALIAGWYWFRPELLFIDKVADDAAPAKLADASPADSRVLAEGMFHGVAHETQGTARIHQLADGKRLVRFTDFATSNGPDVRVLLVAAEDAVDSKAVQLAETIELGRLRGNKGDQNYELPAGVDLNKYRSVTVWCYRFSVNFGTAPLALSSS